MKYIHLTAEEAERYHRNGVPVEWKAPKSHSWWKQEEYDSFPKMGFEYRIAVIDFNEQLASCMNQAANTACNIRYEAIKTTPKSRPDLFPADALALAGEVLAFGLEKHPSEPWRTMSVDDHLGACWRHMLEWKAGRKNDAESSKSHLAHSLVRLAMALDRSLDLDARC